SAQLFKLFPTEPSLFNIFIDHTQTIWLTSGNGMHVYNPYAETYTHIKQTNENRLYSNRVWQVLEDHSHNIWIATMGGLNKLRPSWFQHVDLGMLNYSPFPIIDVPGNRFMAAGQSEALHFFDLNTKKKDTIHLSPAPFPVDNYTNTPEIDIRDAFRKNDILYLAFANRIGRFDKDNHSFIQYIELPNLIIEEREINNKVLFTIDAPQSLWIAAIDGLYEIDYTLDSINSFLPFLNNVQSMLDLDNRYVKDVSPIGENYLIRTASNILLFDPKKKQLTKKFSFSPNNYQTSLANGNCYVDTTKKEIWFSETPKIYRMSATNFAIDTFNIALDVEMGDCQTYKIDSLLWIATNNGLIRFNPGNQRSVRYTTSDGISDNNINGVFPDIHGNIWISTIKGLSRMNIATEETESFFRKNDFDTYSFLKQHHRHPNFKNDLVLPTTKGFFRFNPDSLNPHRPPIIISNITIFGKNVAFDSVSHHKRHIELPFKQNFITFELAALDYTEPSKNEFRYKLRNFNEQWIYTDANNRKAPYTGLPPGDYVFVAQGSNNDGVWSDEMRVRLIIHPPWYRTTFAYISYILLTVFSIVFFIRYRERKLKYEKKVLEEKVRQRTAEIRKQNEEITNQRDEIAAQKKDITDSIHYASRIQAALLPSDEFAKSVLDSYFILFKPRDIVSGDYYWLAQIDNKTIVVAADCTGHGVPGAFMSMLGVAFLNEIVVRDQTIAANEILDRLRQYIIKSLKQTGSEGGSKDGMDVALTIIDHATSTAQFAGAYNPLYIIRNGELETIKADRMPIGYHIKVNKPFTNNHVQLQKGDRLYTFSDGYPDQFGGEKGRKFMSKQFKNLLIETCTLEMSEQKKVLDETIEAWKGDTYEQIDDILVIGIKI
ncbi:MAG: SpoIIE family protein phosphatase, partial [Salinivirgaceae bacterium]